MSQDDDHEQALEVAAATVHIDHTIEVRRARDFARTAITAYLSALPERELLAEALERDAEDDAVRLHKLATNRFEEIIVLKARLAEALGALEPFVRFEQKGLRIIDDEMMRDELTIGGFFNSWNFEPFPTYGDLRRARAAADKIRAALEHDKGEPKP